MKRKILILNITLLTLLFLPLQVSAHPGRTDDSGCHYCRTNCAKYGLDDNEYHCHSGDTYTNSKGQIFNKDGSLVNNTLAPEPTPEPAPTPEPTAPAVNNNPVVEQKPVTEQNATIKEEPKKSNDTTLKYIKIDGKEINISNEIKYETRNKTIDIDIKATNDNATIDFKNDSLNIGKNKMVITVTAEDGTKKEYFLIVTRQKVDLVTIKEFKLDSNKIEFKDNKAIMKKMSNETSFKYSYELSDENGKLLIYVNNKEVKELNNIKDKDIIKLVTVNSEDVKNIYEINIENYSSTYSTSIEVVSTIMAIAILLSPVVIIIAIVRIHKKKKTTK